MTGDVMKTLEDIRIELTQIECTQVCEMYSKLDNYLLGGISDKDEWMQNHSSKVY
jgi:hypothetical protein